VELCVSSIHIALSGPVCGVLETILSVVGTTRTSCKVLATCKSAECFSCSLRCSYSGPHSYSFGPGTICSGRIADLCQGGATMEASAQRASLPGGRGQGRNASFQVSSGCRCTTARSSWEACGQWPGGLGSGVRDAASYDALALSSGRYRLRKRFKEQRAEILACKSVTYLMLVGKAHLSCRYFVRGAQTLFGLAQSAGQPPTPNCASLHRAYIIVTSSCSRCSFKHEGPIC
jgi:hypothetical protein